MFLAGHHLLTAKPGSLDKQSEVWEENFAGRLQIRSKSHHTTCATCTKHKLIIKKLRDNQCARACQLALWGRHMDRQFADRRVYWDNRAVSRIGQTVDGQHSLTIIIDSMDHMKWSLPRTAILSSKTFSSFARPHMDCTGIIVHGHLVAVAFAEPHIVKGADWTAELLMYAFNKLTMAGIDLRGFEINLQSDNSSRECKNNVILRLLSLLTSTRRIGCARMLFLASGHSHEDIDQFFSLLGSFLQTHSELHCPEQFLDAMRQYLANPSVRPLEGMKDVLKVDSVRAWTPPLLASV